MRPTTELDPVLILPGLCDSGPQHWQTLWMAGRPGFRRVEQIDWVTPRCSASGLGSWPAGLELLEDLDALGSSGS